jgi:hypothetical protein
LEWFGRLELVSDRLLNTLPATATAQTIIDMIVAYIATHRLVETEENILLQSTLSTSSVNTCSAICAQFVEQDGQRDLDKAKPKTPKVEAAHFINNNKGKNHVPKPGSPTCNHCGKTHTTNECWTTFPHKKPEWIKLKDEDQRRKRAAKTGQPSIIITPSTTAATAMKATVEDWDKSSDEEESTMVVEHAPKVCLANSSSRTSTNTEWNTDTGATLSMTPHKH